VRHLMDIDLVKFSPFDEKLNGLVHRKGETSREQSHVTTEPMVDQSFAFRSLLLYHTLTGEEWSLDLAKQLIERLAWYGKTRLSFGLFGDRPAVWLLRGAIAGARYFPEDPATTTARLRIRSSTSCSVTTGSKGGCQESSRFGRGSSSRL
jgi:hypothetical protein